METPRTLALQARDVKRIFIAGADAVWGRSFH